MKSTSMLVLMGLVLSGALFGCASSMTGKEMVENPTPSKDFLLGPEDILEVVVWRNQDLSRQVVVRPDGMISMPLIGDVQAAGVTADQLSQRLAKRLLEFKENPAVSVSVKEVNSYNVFVLGEVTRPGKYQLKSYTTVLQAISMAGGFTPFASKNKLQVVRQTPNGNGGWKEVRLNMPYDDLLTGRSDPNHIVINSGDTIVVP